MSRSELIDTVSVEDATLRDKPGQVTTPRTVAGVVLTGVNGTVELYGSNELRDLAAVLVRIAAQADCENASRSDALTQICFDIAAAAARRFA